VLEWPSIQPLCGVVLAKGRVSVRFVVEKRVSSMVWQFLQGRGVVRG